MSSRRISASMILPLLILVVLLLTPMVIADAHGLCLATASVKKSGSTVKGPGEFDCGTSIHAQVVLEVTLQKKNAGGSWVNKDFFHGNKPNAAYFSHDTSTPCVSGTYRSRVDAWAYNASGDLAHEGHHQSPTKNITC
jgi:hypothetical protein